MQQDGHVDPNLTNMAEKLPGDPLKRDSFTTYKNLRVMKLPLTNIYLNDSRTKKNSLATINELGSLRHFVVVNGSLFLDHLV